MAKKQSDGFRLPIQRKLFLFFLFAIILPLLLFGSFLFSQQVHVLENEIQEAAQRELVQMAERINLEFTQIRAVSNLFYLDDAIVTSLQSLDEDPGASADIQRELNQRVAHYNTGLNNIHFKAMVLTSGGQLLGNETPFQTSVIPPRNFEQKPWYKQLQNRPSDIVWITDATLNSLLSPSKDEYVCLVRQLHDRNSWTPLGTLVVGIAKQDILKMYYGYVGWDQSCYIIDQNDELISSVQNFTLGDVIDLSPEEYASFSGSFFSGTGRSRLLVNYYTISSTQWKIVTCSDLSARLSGFSDLIGQYFTILLLYLALSIVLSVIMASRFTKPITNLYGSIRQVQAGNLMVQAPVSTKDEVGEVATQFNKMLLTIRGLMDDVMQEQKLKRDAEILSLQTQINPHLIYNTLASIRFLVYTGGKETADKAILSLIRLMKNTLSDEREFITVENEFDVLEDYIQLQKLAFDRPVAIDIDLDPEILDCKTIKLLLQPVVENAFLHGLKPKKGDLSLSISGKPEGKDLVFVIKDNGVGFDTDTASYADRNPSSRSIGLRNVHNRIVLTFGDEYGLTVTSLSDEGTTVVLRIPQIHSKGEYSSYEHFDR